MKISWTIVVAFIMLTAISYGRQQTSPTSSDYSHYLDQFVDKQANPADDFFKYANGKWIKEHPIPSNERAWGVYNLVQEETYKRLININEMSSKDKSAQAGSNSQKIGDFWFSAMDTNNIEKQGITPLKEELDRIAAIHDMPGLLETTAHLKYIGVGAMFGQY